MILHTILLYMIFIRYLSTEISRISDKQRWLGICNAWYVCMCVRLGTIVDGLITFARLRLCQQYMVFQTLVYPMKRLSVMLKFNVDSPGIWLRITCVLHKNKLYMCTIVHASNMTCTTLYVQVAWRVLACNLKFRVMILKDWTQLFDNIIFKYNRNLMIDWETVYRRAHTGASFQLFLGGATFFFIFQCHRTIEKLEKTAL